MELLKTKFSIMETEIDISKVSAVSEIEIVYRSKVNASLRPRINTSFEAVAIFRKYWNLDRIGLLEECFVMYLNRANRVLAIFPASLGGICGTVVDPRIIFAVALKLSASNLILAHNHPSQSVKPSLVDIDLTRKMRDGGKILQINVLDHLIICEGHDFYSMADSGDI